MAYHKNNKTASQVGAEIQADITAKFIDCLNKGCVPWREQWNRSNSGFLSSSGKSYSFLNTLLLALGGCTVGEFVTVNGVAERNHTSVKDGSVWAAFKRDENGKIVKGHRVYFYTMLEYTRKEADGTPKLDEHGNEIKGHYPILKASTVWQVGKEVDCPLKFAKNKVERVNNPIAKAEEIIINYQARESIPIDYVLATPGYSSTLDRIHVPPLNEYKNSNFYYSDIFHEIAHSTGHPKRLNRELANRMERNSYSFEELVAEICSNAVMHDNGFDTPQCDAQSESYIKGWAKALKSDPTMVEKACRLAVKAANYIYNGK